MGGKNADDRDPRGRDRAARHGHPVGERTGTADDPVAVPGRMHAVAAGRSELCRKPMSARHFATSVAPFQLTCATVPPESRVTTTFGGSVGRPIHGARNAR